MTSKNNIKPLNDYILVEPIERETTTASGIVIPDTGKEKPLEGKVVALGPGKLNEKGERMKIGLKKADIVIYKKWGGTEIKVEGKEMLLVKEEDILAVIEK